MAAESSRLTRRRQTIADVALEVEAVGGVGGISGVGLRPAAGRRRWDRGYSARITPRPSNESRYRVGPPLPIASKDSVDCSGARRCAPSSASSATGPSALPLVHHFRHYKCARRSCPLSRTGDGRSECGASEPRQPGHPRLRQPPPPHSRRLLHHRPALPHHPVPFRGLFTEIGSQIHL